MLRKSVQKRANFDIKSTPPPHRCSNPPPPPRDVNPLAAAACCFSPVVFAHATGDDFIRPQHSAALFAAYAGDKNIIQVEVGGGGGQGFALWFERASGIVFLICMTMDIFAVD
jgi:hypothetical protein